MSYFRLFHAKRVKFHLIVSIFAAKSKLEFARFGAKIQIFDKLTIQIKYLIILAWKFKHLKRNRSFYNFLGHFSVNYGHEKNTQINIQQCMTIWRKIVLTSNHQKRFVFKCRLWTKSCGFDHILLTKVTFINSTHET